MIVLSRRDPRIQQECTLRLPGQPQVAAYIACRLGEMRGTVLVARVICETLVCHVPCASIVTQETVDRLAVDHDPESLRLLDLAAQGEVQRMVLGKICGRLFEPREGFRLDAPQIGAALAIANCALAMLTSGAIDTPRKQVA